MFTSVNWCSSNDEMEGHLELNSIAELIETEPIKILNAFPILDSILKIEFNVPIKSIDSTYDYSIKSNLHTFLFLLWIQQILIL